MSVGDNFRSEYLIQGQALGKNQVQVSLTADNQVINPYNIDNGYSMINIASDNTTAANRTFTLLAGQIDGHDLLLVFTSGSSTTAQLVNSGNVVLAGNWEPIQNDVLRLVWNAYAGKWLEVSRRTLTASPTIGIVYTGTFTTVGGDATESIPVVGAVAGDVVAVTVRVAGATPRSIVASVPTTDAITVTMSGDPSTDHILQYIVTRSID